MACNASSSKPAPAVEANDPPKAKATPGTTPGTTSEEAPTDQPLSLAAVPRASPLNRPAPGTDWDRHGDLIGPVKRVRTTVTSPDLGGEPGEKTSRTEVVEFNVHGQRIGSWYNGEQHEKAELGPDGNVVKLVGVPDPDGAKMRPTYEYLAYDDAHRVVRESITMAKGAVMPAVDQIVTYAYDEQGHTVSETRAGSPGSDGVRAQSTTTFTYDAEGDWITRTDSDGTTSRVLVAIDATNKTLETVSGSVSLREVIDRSTGRLVSTGTTLSTLVNTYTAFDDQKNWTKLSTHRRRPSNDELEWAQDVVREIDYFE